MKDSPEDKTFYLNSVVDGALDIALGAYARYVETHQDPSHLEGYAPGARAGDIFGYYSAEMGFYLDHRLDPEFLLSQRAAIREDIMKRILKGLQGYPLDHIPQKAEILNPDGTRMPPGDRRISADATNPLRAEDMIPGGPFADKQFRPDHPLRDHKYRYTFLQAAAISALAIPTMEGNVPRIYGGIRLENRTEPIGRWELWHLKD